MEFDQYPPLKLLKELQEKLPRGLEMMKEIHRSKNSGELTGWPDWCYAPLAAAASVVYFERPDEYPARKDEYVPVPAIAQILAFLAPWSEEKKVYAFDLDMEEYLTRYSAVLTRIPSTDLLRIPHACFYVQTNTLSIVGYPIHGFFVSLDYEPENGKKELHILFLYDNGGFFVYTLPINENTVFVYMQLTLDELLVTENNAKLVNDPDAFGEEDYREWKKLLEYTMNLTFFVYLMKHYKEDDGLVPITKIGPIAGMNMDYISKPEDLALHCMAPFSI